MQVTAGANFFSAIPTEPDRPNGLVVYKGMDFSVCMINLAGRRQLVLQGDPICKAVSETTALQHLQTTLGTRHDFAESRWEPTRGQIARAKGEFQGLT